MKYHLDFSFQRFLSFVCLDLCPIFCFSRFKTLLANRPCGENTCIEISNVKYHIFQVRNVERLLNHTVVLLASEMNPMFIVVCQLVMQYLYCGGTEALHIRNTDVMEVRSFLQLSQLYCAL